MVDTLYAAHSNASSSDATKDALVPSQHIIEVVETRRQTLDQGMSTTEDISGAKKGSITTMHERAGATTGDFSLTATQHEDVPSAIPTED